MIFSQIILWACLFYVVAGAASTAYVMWVGLGRIDPAAAGATVGFKLLIIPSLVFLWPVIVGRLRSGDPRPPAESTPHKDMWIERP